MNHLIRSIGSYELIEEIQSGVNTAIYRAAIAGTNKGAIVKLLKAEYPTLEEITRFKHEYQILQHLNPLEGIVKPYSLETYKNGLALILEDFGGESLKNYIASKKIELSEFLKIAIQIASALAEVHKKHVIHKDIKPQNILINPNTGEVKLADFSIATRLERENAAASHPHFLEGTLAYMSPEQTGRMNRSIDYRTDLYSLGVTLYEMLTGVLPCTNSEPLELVYCHIAQKLVPPQALNPEIPPAISDIVMKLLAKNAEDRYQTAEGLKFDLETCLVKLQATGSIYDFVAGSADKASQLNIPQKLYGREPEVNKLLKTFDRVANGTTELMLVSGYSGIGKTVLVNEVHKPIVRQRGYFIAGKFDQFKRNIPYASLIQAFQSLILQLLTESEAEIKIWQENLLGALGVNGQIIVDVIPEVELIIGKQPPVPELGATESQNRFSQVFKQFIGVFTTQKHPLVVFLDDLQWTDSASLKLIELLMTDTDSQYLLLIGAYRDNEVFPTHSTIQTIEKIQHAGATVNNIVLGPLQIVHVEELIADTLNESVRSKLLAELLLNKTQGNPFFLTQLLKTLYQEDLLNYELYLGAWQWDIKQIQAFGITDLNVVELVARNIRKLSEDTQKILKLAACIGNTFNLDVLAIVNEQSSLVTAAQLWSALQAGLILPLSNEYKIPLVFSQEEAGGFTLTDVKVDYKFLHDRVQQAAYSLISEIAKKATHLKIGQLLLQKTATTVLEENIFDIVNQLNIGIDLISQQSERDELASLNLMAGKRAKAAAAYEAAVRYLTMGLELLPNDSWHSHYDLTLNLYVETLESEYLTANFERAQHLSEIVLSQAKTLLDKIKVYELRIPFYLQQNQPQAAIDTGLQVLEMVGVSLEQEPQPRNRVIEDFANLPEMTDSYKLIAMRILVAVLPATFMTKPELFPMIAFKMVNLSVEYGNSSLSAYGYCIYGMSLCGSLGEIEKGYQFGLLALRLLEQFDAKELKSKVKLIFNFFVAVWKQPIKKTFNLLREGFQNGLETGDAEYAGYCILTYFQYQFWGGENLEIVSKIASEQLDFAFKHKLLLVCYQIQIWNQFILNVTEKCTNKIGLVDDSFNQKEMLPNFVRSNNQTMIAYVYLMKSILLYLFKEYKQAVELTNLTQNYANSLSGTMHLAEHIFYHSLSLTAYYKNQEAIEQEQSLKQVEKNQKKFQLWGSHCPQNFQHKYELVEAERARISGDILKAQDYYDRAITGAKQQGYTQEEALANELAAEFYFSRDRTTLAEVYLTQSYYAYIRWGATAKVQDLEERYPQFFSKKLKREVPSMEIFQTTSSPTSTGVSHLDITTIMKASQALAGEIVLDKLLSKLMLIVRENAGAQKGCLILEKDGELFVEATMTEEGDEVNVLQSIPVYVGAHLTNNLETKSITSLQNPPSSNLPLSVINYVTRTRENLVLNDANAEPRFSTDPYIVTSQPKSLLCTPLIHQGKLVGLLYLENNLTQGAFTSDRLEILRLLSSQAAISIENARLYTNLETAKNQLQDYSKTL